MDLPLHHHPVLPPTVPLARGDGGNVLCRALDPVLDVVAIDAPCMTTDRAQHVIEPKEAHRWPHTYIHLTEMHEDRHQGDGVW
jgi:hypothetical protein